MLISQNPRILSFNDDNVAPRCHDFWRPNYDNSFVNGIYSTQQYLDSLKQPGRNTRNGLAHL